MSTRNLLRDRALPLSADAPPTKRAIAGMADPASWAWRIGRKIGVFLASALALADRLGRRLAGAPDAPDDPRIWGPPFRDRPQARLGPVTLSWGCYSPSVIQAVAFEPSRVVKPSRRG